MTPSFQTGIAWSQPVNRPLGPRNLSGPIGGSAEDGRRFPGTSPPRGLRLLGQPTRFWWWGLSDSLGKVWAGPHFGNKGMGPPAEPRGSFSVKHC
jgi:hypothetical protein